MIDTKVIAFLMKPPPISLYLRGEGSYAHLTFDEALPKMREEYIKDKEDFYKYIMGKME